MKTASNELINALQNYADVRFAELYTFTLLDNSVYKYTSLDVNVGAFLSGELFIRRGSMRQAIGLDVDDLDLTIIPNSSANIAGTGWLAAIRNGALDGASVILQKAFFKWWEPGALIETTTFFTGNVSDIDPLGRSAASLRVKSAIEMLAVQWPRMTYESQCVWRLYDSGCGASKTNFLVSGNTSAGGNTRVFPTSLGQANNYFNLGVIRFTSGNNLDLMRTVQAYSAGNVTVAYPLLNSPGSNDSFQIYPGCDKTRAVCANTFNNTIKFRGFPFIPSPEAAY